MAVISGGLLCGKAALGPLIKLGICFPRNKQRKKGSPSVHHSLSFPSWRFTVKAHNRSRVIAI